MVRDLLQPVTVPNTLPISPSPPIPAKTNGRGAALAADILALGRAAVDVIGRAIRSAPEFRANRVMARCHVDFEDLLSELEPMSTKSSIPELAARLGVSTAQIRGMVLRLQRLSLVKLTETGAVSLTPEGGQRLARAEMARAAVLRRIAGKTANMPPEHAELVLGFLELLIERAEDVVDDQLSQGRTRPRDWDS